MFTTFALTTGVVMGINIASAAVSVTAAGVGCAVIKHTVKKFFKGLNEIANQVEDQDVEEVPAAEGETEVATVEGEVA